MIRLPFSADSHPADPKLPREEVSLGNEGSAHREGVIEARLAALELKLALHAEELHTEVSGRVERIQSRLENVVQFFGEEKGISAEANVVKFAGGESSMHHLHATNAKVALNELNETLHVTRKHLDALGDSVARMRTAVDSRSA